MEHRAVFQGRILKKKYRVDQETRLFGVGSRHLFEPSIEEYTVEVEHDTFHQCYLDSPLLENNELVYIEALDLHVKVTSRVRILEGGYLYLTNHVIETIDDEETAKSKEEAESHFAELMEEYNKARGVEKKYDEFLREKLKETPVVRKKKWFW